MAALGLLVDKVPANVNLVVGLPVSHYTGLKEIYIKNLKQTHYFDAISPDGQVKRKYVVTVHGLKVLPQPLGTLFNLLLDDYGDIENPDITKQNIGVIDVGYHTTDLARADNMEFIDRKSASYPIGIYNVLVELAESLSRSHGIEVQPENLEDVVQAGRIKVGGKTISVEYERQEALNNIAGQIISKLKSLWPDRWQLDRLAIAGGGGQLLAESLFHALDGRAELAPCPLYSNVAGYMKLANRSWR